MSNINISLFIECLVELSDLSNQRSVWLGEKPDQQSSLLEAAEGLFNDSGYEFVLEKEGAVFGTKIDKKLEELAKKISNIDARIVTKEAISGIKMEQVRYSAVEILSLLKQRI
ncbi:MAG: hypothetical protein COB08_008890 [Rhodobacteraceae bacterium]|nr:hypothetical protein [Paracoccaceae bacterium]